VAEETAPPKDAQQGPARSSSRALASGAFGLAKRFLTLREGSVVLITALTFLYFSVNTPEFFTNSNFKSLLPYFAPIAILGAGEVLLMINGEIDLSIGAVYLFAPFLFYELTNSGLPLVPSLIIAMLGLHAGRRHQRILHRDSRHRLVHRHSRHAAGP